MDIILDSRETIDNGRKTTEYLVKWVGKSHIHNTWIIKRRLKIMAEKKLSFFINKNDDEIKHIKAKIETWKTVDRIVDQE